MTPNPTTHRDIPVGKPHYNFVRDDDPAPHTSVDWYRGTGGGGRGRIPPTKETATGGPDPRKKDYDDFHPNRQFTQEPTSKGQAYLYHEKLGKKPMQPAKIKNEKTKPAPIKKSSKTSREGY